MTDYQKKISEYLKQNYRIEERIKSNIEEIKSLKEFSVQYSIPCDSSIKIISDETQELIRLKTEIKSAISKVKDYKCRRLLQLRYIDFLTWEETAEQMLYSVVHIHRIHLQALDSVIIQSIHSAE